MAQKRTTKQTGQRQYKMTVAGQLFKHLGLQMYSGAVPAISELISNAYDAMAKNVWITLPTGHPIQQTDVIIVKDDGHGMSFEECNSHYLSVGRNRRSGESEWTKAYNGLKPRKVQGRKGIGKLAGFGIADQIEIRTVKDKQIAHFALNFTALTKSQNFADKKGYAPEVRSGDDTSTKEKPGTTVMIKELDTIVLSRDIPEHGLSRGDIGAVVHRYKGGNALEIEFVTGEGQTFGVVTLDARDVRPMHANEILHVRELKAT